MTDIEINQIKTTYKPKEGYKLLLGTPEDGNLLCAVYKIVEVLSRKYGKEEAETAVFVDRANTVDAFTKKFNPYIEKR